MAASWSTTTRSNLELTRPNDTGNEGNDAMECDPTYLPTISEMTEGLGAYQVSFLVVGGVLTGILYLLFIEQVFFTFRNAHKVYRTHIYWITSIYPFMTMMTMISVIMPRADTIASGIKAVYMCIGISHFIDLTKLMFGSEKVMLAKLQGCRFTISTGPSCCCCRCLPTVKITQERLRMIRWMVWQMPYMQAIYFTIAIFWNIAESDENGHMNPNKGYLSLQVINLLSFMCGVWALNIISVTAKDQLEIYGYAGKSFLVKTCILITRFQSFILDVLGMFDIYPCIGTYISPIVFKIVLEQTLYIIEMILLGPYTYWQFRTYAFLTKNPTEVSALPEFQSKSRGVSVVSKMSMAEENRNSKMMKDHEVINCVDQQFVAQSQKTIAISVCDCV